MLQSLSVFSCLVITMDSKSLMWMMPLTSVNVSKRDGPVSFLQMQPCPHSSGDEEGFRSSHPMLLVVAGEDTKISSFRQCPGHLGGTTQDTCTEAQSGNFVNAPTSVRFYSLQSHGYVHVLRFGISVCFIRCSVQIVAVGLAKQVSTGIT